MLPTLQAPASGLQLHSVTLLPVPQPVPFSPLWVLCWVWRLPSPVHCKFSKPSKRARPAFPGRFSLTRPHCSYSTRGPPHPTCSLTSQNLPQGLGGHVHSGLPVRRQRTRDLQVGRKHVPSSWYPALTSTLASGGLRKQHSEVCCVSCVQGGEVPKVFILYEMGPQTG